jgi:hypothetical protein
MATNEPNFAEMTDEEITNYDLDNLSGTETEEVTEPEETPAVAPDTSDDTGAETLEDTDGADPSDSPAEVETDESDAVEEGEADDTQVSTSAETDNSPEDDQSSDTEETDETEEDSESDDFNYETAYKELMAPFRAARREVKLDNITDARRLLKMGVDYSRKMELMKPHLRILRTLDKAGLTDPEQVNFLIDLHGKNPDAIKKLLKDGSIDPMDLDLEDSKSYTPNDHIIGDTELALSEAFDSISESPKYQDVLTTFDGMDTASKQQLQDNPSVIPVITQHLEAGIFEKVWAKVETERMFGRLVGLSDLDAYYATGEAMHKAGVITGTPEDVTSPGKDTTQASAPVNGSPAALKAKAKRQKRAASPTRGRATKPGKKMPDLSTMSDEEIEKIDLSAYM